MTDGSKKSRQTTLLLEDTDTDYVSRGQRMVEVARARGDVEKADSESVQLPIWPEPERVTPNAMLRSALFSCARRRAWVDNGLIASWAGTEIRFSGEVFNQFDEIVWMQLIHMFRQQGEPADMKVRFNAKPLVRALGKKGRGGKNVLLLRKSMTRLRGGTLVLKHGGLEYHGGILNDFSLDEDRGDFVATINPKYIRLLEAGHTRVDWETHKALPTGISTWMHRYILSHRATVRRPHRIGLDQLRQLSGMASELKEFRRHLQRTMDKLEAHGVVASWKITQNDALEYVRPRRTRKG